MKIYTRTGDSGETSLFGGQRVPKDDIRIEAYGTIDELNSVIGVALLEIDNSDIYDLLKKVQNQLFTIGSDLATPIEKENSRASISGIKEHHITELENAIDFFDAQLEPLRNFILPGGSGGAVYLHLARTVCRRAERRVITLTHTTVINQNIILFLNRLSDLLFVLARFENRTNGIMDVPWKKETNGN